MTPALRIAVADDEPRMRDYYQDTLPLLGHRVTCAARPAGIWSGVAETLAPT